MNENNDQYPLGEPSVLDYLKSKLFFWRKQDISIPEAKTKVHEYVPPQLSETKQEGSKLSWRVAAAFVLALLAQILNQATDGVGITGLLIYAAAAGLAIWAFWLGELSLPEKAKVVRNFDVIKLNWYPLMIGLFFTLAAFWTMGGNQFTLTNTMVWIMGVVFTGFGIWQFPPKKRTKFRSMMAKIWDVFRDKGSRTRIIQFAAIFLIAVFFRTWQLGEVVPEMVSDHAEKLLDVVDVLNGDAKIFFPRNTGREALQFYLIAITAKITGLGASFISMKLGTVLAGILMLPYIYLLGKEIGNHRVGLIAMLLLGVAYWPNILARVALRFILYPVFAAPVIYHFLRGLRKRSWNDFILAGVFLGIGLHGYTPFRIIPILITIGIIIYILHGRSKERTSNAVVWISLVGLVSLLVFIPLLRFWVEYPDIFSYRAFSRLTNIDQSIDRSVIGIFFSNLWSSLGMMTRNGGLIWVVSLTSQPTMGFVSAAMYVMGSWLLVARYFRDRSWKDIFLVISIPMLMMPSILSISYPAENPAPNRAGGVMVVTYVLAALMIDAFLRAFESWSTKRNGRILMYSSAGLLLGVSLLVNYYVTFNQFPVHYETRAWNTSEMGAVIADFVNAGGDKDNAWVVASPHWVDNRLVGINAGFPDKNYELFPEEIDMTLSTAGSKLFIVRLEEMQNLEALKSYYPEGYTVLYDSRSVGKDFWIFQVDG
jgi:hypothetical protein